MRIVFATAGGSGHLHPLVALARAFTSAGHEVIVATPPDDVDEATRLGLDACPIGWELDRSRLTMLRRHPEYERAIGPERGAASLELLFAGTAAPAAVGDLVRVLDELGADLVVHEPRAFAAPLAAAVHGVPNVCCGTGPMLPIEWTAAASARLAPLWEAWGVAPRPHGGIYRHLTLDPRPPGLQAGPTPPGPSHAIRPTLHDLAPGELDVALPAGPIAGVWLGSVFNDALGTRQAVFDGLAGYDAAIVDSVSNPGLALSTLCARAEIVVTHGGAASTLTALAAGVPVVLLPFGGDQFLDAEAVTRSGVGAVVPAAAATPEAVRAAVESCRGAAGERAASIAQEIAAMPAVETIVELLAEPPDTWVGPAALPATGTLRVTVGGHATAIVETDQCRVIIDPVFGDTIGSGAVRFAPARRWKVEALGPLTQIVLTHRHLDHFDPASLVQLPRDVEVITPPDPELVGGVRALGFENITTLATWGRWTHGDLELVATPSEFEVDEFGVIARSGRATYWHMSDSWVTPEVGARVRQQYGPMQCVAARYQPGTLLPSVQRSIGVAHDERRAVVDWLEAACATDPGLVFPSFWGVGYAGEHAWADRYVAPFPAARITRLLVQRLGPGRAVRIRPGDMIEIDGSTVADRAAASDAVVADHDGDPGEAYEPVDTATLLGVEAGERAEIRTRLEDWFRTRFFGALSAMNLVPWIEWQVVWQVVVHLGDGERLEYHIDFTRPELMLQSGVHPDRSYVVHLAGRALLDVLRGDAGSELFWLAGASRMYETVLAADADGFRAPPWTGWELFEQLPEPLTGCLRYR